MKREYFSYEDAVTAANKIFSEMHRKYTKDKNHISSRSLYKTLNTKGLVKNTKILMG